MRIEVERVLDSTNPDNGDEHWIIQVKAEKEEQRLQRRRHVLTSGYVRQRWGLMEVERAEEEEVNRIMRDLRERMWRKGVRP